ncbi:MAG: cobalamin biosynthesis protein CbiG [Lachnospiraceae bacterium]|nr:cobalamin biosynthesis protein CbiG [Lachnospiraceae bacterium]
MSKKVSVVAFTEPGLLRMTEVETAFLNINERCGEDWIITCSFKPENLKEWCAEAFAEADCIFFVCATGIAVRTIAPFLISKTKDPAVLVMDDLGLNLVALISGHIGGANELAGLLAADLEAHPVITTSSDVHGKIPIDAWAIKNNLYITDMIAAKKVAMELVEGRRVGLYCDCGIVGMVPEELVLLDGEEDLPEDVKWSVVITHKILSKDISQVRKKNILWLIPRLNAIGVGCKRGKTCKEIEAAVKMTLEDAGIDMRSIGKMASIDIKSVEDGLQEFAMEYNIPLSFFSGKELDKLPGDFQESDFVKGITGVDNVCERAAIMAILRDEPGASRDKNLLVPKNRCHGVTVAVAGKKGSIIFE